MPSIDLSSMAMYPTVIGWGVLYTIGFLLILFAGSFLSGVRSITDWWSTFVWSTVLILLVMLATINGSYNAFLVNMHMCNNALQSFIQVAMSMLSLITIIIFYIMKNDFGTNQNVNTYLFIMLHVNLLCSLLNLCFVTMQKMSNLNLEGITSFGLIKAKLEKAFDPNKNGLRNSVDATNAQARRDLNIR